MKKISKTYNTTTQIQKETTKKIEEYDTAKKTTGRAIIGRYY